MTLRIRPTLFALACAMLLQTANAATYYVNPEGGSDSFSGTTAAPAGGSAGPWQTLARLGAATLVPGDAVYLACGAVWNETLRVPASGTPAAPINIAAGPGACGVAPQIDGAIPIPASAWVQHSGSIYRARLPIDLIDNPTPTTSLAGWTKWSANNDAVIALDSACPGQTTPCLAFTTGLSTTNSLAISNSFALSGGGDYAGSVQVRAPAGTPIKVLVRRNGPTYENLAPVQWVTGNGAWQNVAVSFRAQASAGNARLDIEAPSTRVRVNIREAHVQRTMTAGVLATYVDNLQIRRAHHPNFAATSNGDSPYARIASAGGKTVLDTSGLALPVGASLAPGLGVTIRPLNFAIEESAVASVNAGRLTLTTPTFYDILPGYGFYLTGALWMLDSPGEWFYDTAASTLYMWMPDGAAPGNRVAVSSLALGADLNGKSRVNLQGISIRHVGTGVAASASDSLALSNLSIADTADFGISAENGTWLAVKASSIARTGLDAISLPGSLATGINLTDSSISDSAASTRSNGWRMLPRPAQAAVYSIGTQSSIMRNTIRGAGNLGVFVGAYGNVAENYVSQTCLTHNDCGAILGNYLSARTDITSNVIENIPGNLTGLPGTPQAHTTGIYIDGGNSFSRVIGNTITGADYGIQIHDSNAITISNNTLFGNRRIQLWMQEQQRNVRAAGDVYANSATSNLLVPTASGPAIYLESELGDTIDFSSFSGNHYSALLSPRVVGERALTTDSSYTTAEWQASGRESAPRATAPVGYVSFLAGAANLLPNGNLANGSIGWSWWNPTAPLAYATLRTCTFGPCLDLRAGGSTSLFSSPNFSVTAGQWYRVSFDAATAIDGQPINVVVRRGGGGSVGYEYLMPSAEAFAGSTIWKRYSFTFQSTKSVIAGDPVTRENGARVDFERIQAGAALSVAHLEMVTLTPAQAALQIKMLLNPGKLQANIDCASLAVSASLCGYFVYMDDETNVSWPASIGPLRGRPIYTRDTTLTDSDGDGIADQQDACPGTPAGQSVNARGCGIVQ